MSENGTPIQLSDIADIRTGPQMRRGIAELDGEGEVVGPEAQLHVRSEQVLAEAEEDALEVAEVDAVVDEEAYDYGPREAQRV